MTGMTTRPTRCARAAGAALTLTLLLGLWLRGRWAGWPLPGWDDLNLRHAHMHLGWYGLLVPLVWALAARAGIAVPGRRWVGAYALAVVVATAGFLAAGYGLAAIAGSTAVLVVWLRLAWAFAAQIGARSWHAVVAPGLLLAALCIPPIAVFTRRDPALAIALVRTFLGLMTWLVLVPVLLAARGWPAPRPAVWLLAASAAALWFGGAWHPALAFGAVVMGLLLVTRALAGGRRGEFVERGLWLGTGAGLAALGISTTALDHMSGVAAAHALVLGPVAASALAAFACDRPRWAALLVHASGLVMAAALVAPHLGFYAHVQPVATWAGVGVAAGVVGLYGGRRRRPKPPVQNSPF